MNFDSFSFDERISAGIRACGYVSPTPIQSRAIDSVLKGRDVLGLAQTGTGKTAAFVLPILQRLLNAEAPKQGPVRVLVLAPTRELALQIHESFVSLGKQTGYRSSVVIGGVGPTPQIKALNKATICVACPGRLLDLMNRGEADLSQADTLVLDEADRMFDMGFLPDLRRIMAKLPRQRQNLLFSATMPMEIRKLADTVLRDPITAQVDNTAPAETVSHVLYPIKPGLKPVFLDAVLKHTEHDCVLVFTRTKHRAKSLARKLEQGGWKATSLQGNLSQNRRQAALDGFRRGDFRIMVATDIAARGIDCERITHVINYDLPDTAENYTHRIGRTGRAERTGMALTFLTDEDTQQLRAIERVLGSRIERRSLPGFNYDMPTPAQAKGPRPGVASRRLPQGGRDGDARSAGRGNGPRRSGTSRSETASRPGGGRPAEGRSAKERSHEGRSQEAHVQEGRAAQPKTGQSRASAGASRNPYDRLAGGEEPGSTRPRRRRRKPEGAQGENASRARR
ncbi:MAG: DEAD/DEAH box helicase [Desulfovibrionaceae bacterium]